ncbi:hypothetical protein D9757_012037 [Collybiopsis confluens]|uniref:Uncharacterized protein n=1 Tax=Collybiopsis confluens TaxID=2823264 RepID=A0A8H5GDT8_9AGAR|nr:hypothetical protein D9757_012037 [Collybiopsis confluens]
MEPHPDETVCFQPLVTLTDAGGTKSGVSLRCFSWTLYALSLVNPVEVPGVTVPKLGPSLHGCRSLCNGQSSIVTLGQVKSPNALLYGLLQPFLSRGLTSSMAGIL